MKTQSIFRMLSLSLLFVLLGSVAMAQTKDEKKAKDAEMKRMAVENEAWRSGRLIAKCGKNKDGFLLRVNHRSKLYSTIEAAVDALCEEG